MKLQLLQPAVPPNRPLRPERGIALVITLSFLLITTVIVIAFLVRARFDYQASASYSAGVQSDLLAAGAMDQVVANFLEEITDTNNSTPATGLPTGLYWFEPKDQGGIYPSMVPAVSTKISSPANGLPPNGIYDNLVKQSASGYPFYPHSTETDVVSNVNSSAESGFRGDRPVTAERWDLPHLLLDTSGTGPATFANTQTPDWIYITGAGEATTSVPSRNSSTPQIVGRYAYNVYDVGGLLNVNVAGNVGAQPKDVATKGSVVLADLTQIPGFNNSDTMVDWRLPGGIVNWSTTGTATNPNINLSSMSLLDYLRVGSASGWLRNPTAADKGNQFLSRRDLITYARLNNFKDALPFLTHFSVDADAPSFSPNLTPAGAPLLAIKSGVDLKESSTFDSKISTVRQVEINPYRWDEDIYASSLKLPSGKSVAAPVLYKRFPLSRLAYVATEKTDRPAGVTDELIQKYFGLVPEDDYTWSYQAVGDPANDPDARIKTLEEVAASNREPNFFEILKSVISVGSLGQSKQIVTNSLSSVEPRANVIDEHILRIGAAIIDQADKDSYPTRIHFRYEPLNRLGEIYGVEDIPYLYGMKFTAYGKGGTTGTSTLPRVLLAQGRLWNPHNPDRSNYSGGQPPSQLRLTALSPDPTNPVVVSGSRWTSNGGTMTSGSIFTDTDADSGNVSTGINFDWNPASQVFQQPQNLLTRSYPPNTIQGGPSHVVRGDLESPILPGITPAPFATPSDTTFGFKIGEDASVPPDRNAVYYLSYTGGNIQFCLKYQAGAQYYTYDRIWFNPTNTRIEEHGPQVPPNFAGFYQGRDSNNNGTASRSDSAIIKTDPRSQRFIWATDLIRFIGPNPGPTTNYATPEKMSLGWRDGLWGNTLMHPGEANLLLDTSARPGWVLGPHYGGSFNAEIRMDIGLVSVNKNDSWLYYADSDGVVRRGMAGLTELPSSYLNSLPTNFSSSNAAIPGRPMQTSLSGPSSYFKNRPVVLNRPFRSVGELANVFRDVPWKNIDFSLQESADTGLLDVFTVYENNTGDDTAPPLVAGKVNLNTAPPPVLEALLSKAATSLPSPSDSGTVIDSNLISDLSTRLTAYRGPGSQNEGDSSANGPLRSLAELVGRAVSGGGIYSSDVAFVGLHPEQYSSPGSDDHNLQERVTTLPRALADVGTTRSWNLMIDLVAQSGKVSENSLDKFAVSSESRWWLFLSIDRFTGRILARSVERFIE